MCQHLKKRKSVYHGNSSSIISISSAFCKECVALVNEKENIKNKASQFSQISQNSQKEIDRINEYNI